VLRELIEDVHRVDTVVTSNLSASFDCPIELTALESVKARMDYGNTSPRVLLRPTAVGLVAGAFACLAALIGGWVEGRLDIPGWPVLLMLFVFPSLVIVFAIGLTLPFRIRIDHDRVQHLLFGCYVLRDYPLADYERMRLNSRGCAAVLEFTGGRRIHFFGAHLAEISRLSQDLSKSQHTRTITGA
jgi:hypothetical protein